MNYEDRVTKEYVEGLLAGMPKIVFGSYVGTGEYGAEHPTSITFDFTPKVVLLFGDGRFAGYHMPSTQPAVIRWGLTASLTVAGSPNGSNVVRYDGNTVSWYCTNVQEPGYQMNSAIPYYYAAIG